MESNGNAEALSRINQKISQLSKAQIQPSTYKVHQHLRNINEKAYEPEIVAIGPYHRGKDNLKMMEEHKVRYLELLFLRKNENVERYVSAVAEMEQEARSCYAAPVELNAAEFIEMLVLDGCFIIELIRKYKSRDSTCDNDPIFQTQWIKISLQRDLILFENQIPFFVLCKLFDLIEAPNQHKKLMVLVLIFCRSLFPGAAGKENPLNRISSQEVKHLLDLIHRFWRLSFDNDAYINVQDFPLQQSSNVIPTATELTNANVTFKRKDKCALFDINFDKGVLLMPRLTIRDRTECFFRNLIAYEQYFPNHRPTFVTDYVVFLDKLISSSRDVEALSQCEIIVNRLGDNEVVADIFNRLTDSVVASVSCFIYAETFVRINNHYKKRWNRMRAVLSRDYFSSPWAYVSFIAAFLLLLLTVAQTVFSALQMV